MQVDGHSFAKPPPSLTAESHVPSHQRADMLPARCVVPSMAREWRIDATRRTVRRWLLSAGWALSPTGPIAKEWSMYEKPAVQRLGSLRELTQGLGPNLGGDPASIYHRS